MPSHRATSSARRAAPAAILGLVGLALGLQTVGHAAGSSLQPEPQNNQRAAGPIAGAAEPVRVNLVTGLGSRFVEIASPDARRSPAVALDIVRDKPSPDAPTTYTLTNRAIVKATDEAIGRLVNEGLAIERSASVPGYAFVSADTVAGAIALADRLRAEPGVERSTVELGRTFVSRAIPDDPELNQAWHLINDDDSGNDINAIAAWTRGYTGQGVTIGIVDEGVFNIHEDLNPNFDFNISQSARTSSHGTSVAGIAVASGSNGNGSAGLAYNATYGPQVYAQTAPTEQVNADALAFRVNAIDIKNNSWGPLDNRAFHPLDPLEADAIELGATTGRDGKGTVYVWAAGNGNFLDRPEYDGFAGSRHTIAIGAIGHLGVRASYNERGSAMMAVAYSDGNNSDTSPERSIFTTRRPTTNNQDLYTPFFGGTSAAAPLATGAVALTLEANPDLTNRDVQHLVVQTAKPVDLSDELWTINGAGRRFNDNYGFGALDAGRMVTAAETWTPVGPIVTYDAGLATANEPVPDNDPANPVTLDFEIPVQLKTEHAEIRVRMTGPYIGDIRLELVSPSGTVSTLAETRFFGGDDMDHLFTSVKHWDERSAGTWTLRVADGSAGDEHTLLDAHLVVRGTCLADQDRSGTIDVNDFQTWLNNYNNESRDADMNGDGGVSPGDFTAWVAFANIGC